MHNLSDVYTGGGIIVGCNEDLIIERQNSEYELNFGNMTVPNNLVFRIQNLPIVDIQNLTVMGNFTFEKLHCGILQLQNVKIGGKLILINTKAKSSQAEITLLRRKKPFNIYFSGNISNQEQIIFE